MAPVSQAVQWVRAEYLELPSLSLTGPQVQRLYGLDEVTCESVLAALVDAEFLACTSDGRYVRFNRNLPTHGLRRRRAA
jgi:hypothetical protein